MDKTYQVRSKNDGTLTQSTAACQQLMDTLLELLKVAAGKLFGRGGAL